MKLENQKLKSVKDVRILHVKVIGGTESDITNVVKAINELKEKLPFKLEAIVTDDLIELQSVDTMIRELYKFKKSFENG